MLSCSLLIILRMFDQRKEMSNDRFLSNSLSYSACFD